MLLKRLGSLIRKAMPLAVTTKLSTGPHRLSVDGLIQCDSHRIDIGADEILLFCCMRNESLRLPFFLEYYRLLGVDRFIFIDNASDDGSADILHTQPDVHVFYTDESYASSRCGVSWLNSVLSRFAVGHWALVVDADELLVYPDCERTRLRDLTGFLDATNSQALQTFMLDMYAGGPLREAHYRQGTDFRTTCPFFDTDSYSYPSEVEGYRIPVRGGVRRRLFWEGRNHGRGQPPYLPKVPLVKWREDLEYQASTHLIEGVQRSNLTGVLQHFKLFSDFAQMANREVERKEHWDSAAQYSAYALVLNREPDLSPMYEGSVPYRDSMQLVEMGFMQMPQEWAQLIVR